MAKNPENGNPLCNAMILMLEINIYLSGGIRG